jgi:nicotinamidase-related amidase
MPRKGYLDLAGFDVSATAPVIEKIKTAVAAARDAGMLIIWFQNGWDEQYVEAGGPVRRTGTNPMRSKPCASVLSYRENCWRKAAGIISWWTN